MLDPVSSDCSLKNFLFRNQALFFLPLKFLLIFLITVLHLVLHQSALSQGSSRERPISFSNISNYVLLVIVGIY